jgi:hypothetical protein
MNSKDIAATPPGNRVSHLQYQQQQILMHSQLGIFCRWGFATGMKRGRAKVCKPNRPKRQNTALLTIQQKTLRQDLLPTERQQLQTTKHTPLYMTGSPTE